MNITLSEWLLIGIFATLLIAAILLVVHQVQTFNRLGGMWYELQYLRNDVEKFKKALDLDGYANIAGIYKQLNDLRHLEHIEKSSADTNYRITKLEGEFDSMNSSLAELYSVNSKLEGMAEVLNDLYICQKVARE
jgi:hypothetical protein